MVKHKALNTRKRKEVHGQVRLHVRVKIMRVEWSTLLGLRYALGAVRHRMDAKHQDLRTYAY
jgi:hypothetical protein